MARQGDIVAEIKLRCPPEAFDLTRAEGPRRLGRCPAGRDRRDLG
jgi:hypothetical protein